jgi:hypothetical protein
MYLIRPFLIKILCYTCRPFTITLASSAFICAGLSDFRIRQRPAQINPDDERPTCVTKNFNTE